MDSMADPQEAAAAGSQGNPLNVLLAAREKQRIDAQANAEVLLAIFKDLPADGIKHKHANQFFKVEAATSQQTKGVCLACGLRLSSTGSSRFVSHLVSCGLLPNEIKQPFKALKDANESSKLQKRQHDNLVKEEAQHVAAEHAAKQAKLVQQSVRAGLKSLESAEADLAIAKFFYANGIAFSAASSEQESYYREMVRKIQSAPSGYVPPNRHKLGGALLDEVHAWMWHKIDQRDPDGSRAMRYCSCYVSDGWDSCDNLPLINSAFITANDGGIYWRSVDTSGKEKNSEYCASLMIADIYEFGPLKVILVVTDTCTTMKKCWKIVMDEFPWIMVLPCQAHVISLLMKDIGKTKQVRSQLSVITVNRLSLCHICQPCLPSLFDRRRRWFTRRAS